jgi:hypothetical protein
MSPSTDNNDGALGRAQQAAAQLKPAAARLRPLAARLKPLARSTGSAARQNVRKSRAWAAPQVARSGKVLQDTVAPKVADMLTSAAQRIEPAPDRTHRWRIPAVAATLSAAAASAAAIFARSRKSTPATSAADASGQARHTEPTPAAKHSEPTPPAAHPATAEDAKPAPSAQASGQS